MQKIATRVFIAASILFGMVGVVMMLGTAQDEQPLELLSKLLGALGFIVLSSFAVSVALKYLDNVGK
jgi:hypothetical protein